MPTSGKPRHQPHITVFTTQTCHWCRVAKRYIAERGLEFAEVDIGHDSAGRKRMVLMTGQRGVPVIQIGDHAMIGWDKAEFEKLVSGKFKRR